MYSRITPLVRRLHPVGFGAVLSLSISSAVYADSFTLVDTAVSGAMTRQLSYHARVIVAPDGTYTDRVSQRIELLSQKGEDQLNPFTITYSAALSNLKVISASVRTKTGKVFVIPSQDIFVRPVAASVGAPMYSHSKVVSILLPKMDVGDVVQVVTEKTQFKPYFPQEYSNYWEIPASQSARDEQIEVIAPKSMHLQAAQREGWEITHHDQGSKEVFVAQMLVHHAEYAGPATVGERQYSPLFEVTSFPSWSAVGAAYWQRANKMAAVTPLVRETADKAAGNLTGWSAQKALFSWDSANIRYVGLELGVGGFVPISATKTLQTKYGDCKAHSTLLQALFDAKGFTLYPAIINWDSVYNLPPLPTPFWFNHAIDYAPKEHLFLDSTGQYETPGQLAVGERDKPTVVTGPHPRIVVTPGAEPAQNHFDYRATLRLRQDGTLAGVAQMQTQGWWAWAYREIFASVPPSRYSSVMGALLAPSGGGVGTFVPGNPTILDRPFQVAARWQSADFTHVGSHITFAVPPGPYLVPSLSGTPNPIAYLADVAGPVARSHPIATYLGGVNWSTVIQIPSGYRVLSLPPAEHLKNAAGSFSYSSQFQNGKLLVQYHLRLQRVVYDPQQYAALRELLLADLARQKSPVIFTKAS